MPRMKLPGIPERVGKPRILVVGDVMLDRYTWGSARRVSPEGPVLVLHADLDEVRPGGAASVAYLLVGLEARVSLCGVTGQDADGRTLRHILDEARVEHSLLVEDAARVTTSKERIVGRAANHPHQLVRVDREDDRPIGRQLEDRLWALLRERLHDYQAVLISDYRKGVCTPRFLARLISAARKQRIPTLIDPAHDVDYARYRGAALLKPNRLEAHVASGITIGSPNDALTAGRLLCERSRVDAVLITLDAEGMVLVPAGGKGQLFPTRRRDVHDVTGAGDMALAMVGLCRAAGLGWHRAVGLANVAAGLEVEKFGVSPITRDEIRAQLRLEAARRVPRAARPIAAEPAGASRSDCDALARPSLRRGKVLSLKALLPEITAHRRAGHKIVFTNGCFDLFHVGHMRCLQRAAALGDVLVVAINSDASVRRLKGAGRPIACQNDRAAILAGLGCVDYVIVFAADTPVRLIRAIRPDVLVKGDEPRPDGIPGDSVVRSYGGRVELVPVLRGISTTTLVERVGQAFQPDGTNQRFGQLGEASQAGKPDLRTSGEGGSNTTSPSTPTGVNPNKSPTPIHP